MARKSRKQRLAPMPAPSLYVHVALYIRLSVEDNKKRGCSVENQKLVLNDFLADKPDFVVYDTYIDNGATGTNFHRPGFQQMLSDIEAGHIDCVIVKDLSRLGRNSIDTGYYIEQYFHTHNVRFIAVTDQFDTADPGSLHSGIMLPLKNMINEAYALDIGRKIKAQARQAMKDGDYIGARAPYGYRKDPDNCHKLLIDEDTAPVVRQIFEWAHGHVALNRIVRNPNEMGITAPSHYKKSTGEITSPGLIGSGKWQTRTVMKILESEVYTGDLVQGKTKILDHQQVKAGEDNLIIARRTHEPIISYELFTAVQEYRKQICEESRAVPKRPYTPNIFKGKVFCADGGRSLHRQRAERKKGPDVYWFHCLTNSRVAKDSCKGVMMQETELIATVTAILEKELSVALGMSLPLFQLEAKQKKDKDRLKTQMSARRQETEKNRRLIRGLYENFVQGILTNEEYFELKADYEESIRTLSGEIEALEKDMDALDSRLVRCRAMEKDAKSLTQDHALTAELIDRLIERIEIDHERNIHVTFRFKSEFQGKAVEPCTKNM
ncbi:hypothetical protein IMSAGC020_01943 [Lachnospiraceae bacterium]|nr:hypothetical protein IMSAGC020_01943 [Lachnospiraceae bacterium]